MRIAQIAPLMESVPPMLYGGTERIVSYLTEELVRLGHEVTLFASGDSVTSAKLVGCVPTALRLDPKVCDVIPYYRLMLDRVRRQAHQFDVLHFHLDYLHFPLFREMSSRVLTTLHGRQDLPDNKPIYTCFDEMRLVSISDSQRIPISNANFAATIYHGIPATNLKATLRPQGGYLAFLVALLRKRVRKPLFKSHDLPVCHSKLRPKSIGWTNNFRERIAPLLDQPDIEFIGEINEQQKAEFLGQAYGLLFPIDWPEPFGLMIEAMACGTPVLAFNRGSVSEIVEDGKTGIVVQSKDEAIEKLHHVLTLDRRRIRHEFERRFSAQRMASDHVRHIKSC
ncbi:glycosyltransferase family 4 protein [Bradyrhizobium sp. AUGA SZCCT0274]|uniref:glycosyltransferase family 4 protein n=1 Tax=Bradyrhizobium sp. AUGA SZCCT0274 TaxID=2807670 RepID=UPI003908BB26